MCTLINILYEYKKDSMVLAINYHKLDDSLVMVFTSSI